jgi:hypothetical protein
MEAYGKRKVRTPRDLSSIRGRDTVEVSEQLPSSFFPKQKELHNTYFAET